MPAKVEIETLTQSLSIIATQPKVGPTTVANSVAKRGRHRKGCGTDFPCHSGVHNNNAEIEKLELQLSKLKSEIEDPQSNLPSDIPILQATADSSDDSQIDVAPNSVHPTSASFVSSWTELRLIAQTFEDVIKLRIAMNNRLQAAIREGHKDGAGVQSLTIAVEALESQENTLSKAMKKTLRKASPQIWDWVQESPGIGEHLVARLLGAIGNPVIAQPYHWEGEGKDRKQIADTPFRRNIGKLWAYCGHGDPTLKRKKGMESTDAFKLGNPHAKMIVHLLAESCVKVNKGPYREFYDSARLKYAARTEWSLGHQHNAALRLLGKEILRDLWLAQSKDDE